MTNRVLDVQGLKGGYGLIQVLHGIDFHVNEGEAVVILGANGAGKTTTLRAICGMIETSGSLKLNGEEIIGSKSADIVRRGVAHVPQGRGTFPELSVEDNLEVGAYTRTDNEVQADMERWYETYPVLYQRRTQSAGSLSGGEQQMLAVARALMSRPSLLLLDEPSLGLAPLIVEDLFERFAALNKEQGVTLLVVEQNAQLALGIADRGYVLASGEIDVEGPADELINDDAIRRAYLGVLGGLKMELFLQRLFDAISNGSTYALVAVALVLIFKATTLINFAQGEMGMLGAFFCLQLWLWGIPMWIALIMAMLLSAVLAAGIERVLIRPFDPADHLPLVIITLGLFLVINAVAAIIWRFDPRSFPNLFGDGNAFSIGSQPYR